MIDFIAEVSSNHNRDLIRMKEFIHSSKEAGCTGVKFQLFKVENLFAPEILEKSLNHRKRKDWELSEKYIPELSELSHKLDMKFSCTPFYLEAVDFLEPFVDFYKIASYELLWKDLFIKCGNTGKPIVFSTGMSTLSEVKDALQWIAKTNSNEVTILHCNSAYPTPIKDSNLSCIIKLEELAKKFDQLNINIGYSDHTVSSSVLYRAVHNYKVKFIEFHIDLDGKGEEYKAGHCWLPDQISEVIQSINEGILADGTGKFEPSISEIPDREWRTDPHDGLRPFLKIRKNFSG
ncbi:MAG: N-acetylneuraminic acid synthase [Gammaproteobacteria bacterium]|nr:N-acetylneuraminic acid synthase [Gammaproteobacteria bacterium]